MRSRVLPLCLAAAVLAIGCGSDGDAGEGPSETRDPNAPEAPPSTICRPTATLALASPVADARARLPMTIAVDLGDAGGMRGAHPLEVTLMKDGAPVKTLSSDAHEPGTVNVTLDPSVTSDLALGAYAVHVKAGCPAGATEAATVEATEPLFLMRLGVTSIDVTDGDGARVELMFHAVNHQYDNVFPITDATAATLALGANEAELDEPTSAGPQLRAFAAPWADLDTPPVDKNGAVLERGRTLPVSLRVGTRPDIVLRIAQSATGNGASPQPTGLTEPGAPVVRLVIDGTPAAPANAGEASRARPGETVTVRLATSPVPSIARVDHVLHWRFEAKTPDGQWAEVPGADASATLRLYGVLGNSQGKTAPQLPWVAVVDDATRVIAGGATEAAAARAILVRHVYEEMGLAYDRAQGASHYTDYVGGGYDAATFKLAHFLARDLGHIVNCSDCASILSTYANMIGADLRYAILGWNFDLHPILGIGSTTFGSPFANGAMSFSYHAVTTADGAATIHDATLAVDGDAAPAQAPFTKRLIQGMPGGEYLQRLSGAPSAGYTYVDKSTSLSF